LPGPFNQLDQLHWGDQVIIHLGGEQYIYEVRVISSVKPDDLRQISQHMNNSWLNLITCKDFDPTSDQFLHRLIVKAVLVDVE